MTETSGLRQLISISIIEPQLSGDNIAPGVVVETEELKRGIFLEPL